MAALVPRTLQGADAVRLDAFLAVHRGAAKSAGAGQWADAGKTYAAFAAEKPSDAGAPLASFLHGLILLRNLNDTAAASKVLTGLAASKPTTPLGAAAVHAAKAWLARLQMARLDKVLRAYWVDEVEYPETLDALVKTNRVKPDAIVDPWGKPFVYTTSALKLAPDMPRQKYVLRCGDLDGTSRDLRKMLDATRGLGKGISVRGYMPGPQPGASVVMSDGTSTIVTQGGTLGSATVVAVTRQAIVLAAPDNLTVLTR